jgi:predicted nucleotidyltransferase
MDIKEIKKELNSEQYNFLRDDEHLGERICLLALGGSLAYGTNLPDGGDVDIRGVTLEKPSELIGLESFEQVVNSETDTTIYGFNKFIKLLMECNPNTIEILGCLPEHYFYMDDVGKKLIDNKNLFLSQKAINSFSGYANDQLNRLQNALARDRISDIEKEKHILRSLQNAMFSFNGRYKNFKEGSIKLYIDEGENNEINADVTLKKFPVREFSGIINDLTNIVRTYNKLSRRNNKKDDYHLNKHAMHLIRLYLMGIDIVEKGEINTYRSNELDMLLDIRKGKYMNEDGTYRKEFFDMQKELENRFLEAAKKTALPPTPDMEAIQKLVMEVNATAINLR